MNIKFSLIHGKTPSMVILPLLGCDTNAGSSSTLNTDSGNAGGEIIVFKTESGYYFPLTFTFNTKEGTVVVDHPIDGNKYGTYTGNLNRDGPPCQLLSGAC